MQFTKKDLDIVFKYVTERLIREKLSDFPDAEALTGREIIPVIQNGYNRNIKAEGLIGLPQVSSILSRYDSLINTNKEEVNKGFLTLNKKLEDKATELQKLIETLEVTGLAISQFYGGSTTLGISQNTLTKNFNLLAQEILSVTGKTLGITLNIVPPFVISTTIDDINITVNSAFGYMDTVEIYANDVLLGTEHNVMEYSITHTIAEDTTIKAKALILGNMYETEKEAKKLFPYFIGAGQVYTDVMKPAYAIPYNGKLTGSFDVSVKQGERIFIIIPTSLRSTIIRTNMLGEEIASVDMNGFEIPFDESTVEELTVFTSKNTYNQGVYNIDITNNVHGMFGQ